MCGTCGAQNAADSRFCHRCGASLTAARGHVDTCSCGAEFGPDEAFCGDCGKPRPTAPQADEPRTKPSISATRKTASGRRPIILGGIAALLLVLGYWYWSRLPANDRLVQALMSAPMPSYVQTTTALGKPEMLSSDKDADPGQVGQVVFPERNSKGNEAIIVRVFRKNAEARASFDESRGSDTTQARQAGSRVTDIAAITGFCLGNADKIFACRAVAGRAVATLIAPKGEPQTVGANATKAAVDYLKTLPQ